MRCDRCTRTHGAIFARMFHRDAYARVCGACRDEINADIPIQLQRLDADVLRGAGMETSNWHPYLGQRFLTRLMAFTALVLGKRTDTRIA